MAEKKGGSRDFEKSLAELEQIVDRLEGGELSLEESLKAFESGVALTRQCRDALEKAEQKVSKLIGDDEQGGLAPFDADGNGANG
ncbi:exodeoxyribonuclease VII small subunit [Natronospira bacteriovora]|uniref:Exodeoxyribonuclease 7 small subunit n=1 Tax=Natronospira bacteriovora TaxID=3069753 RepID=A0ABU0W3F9_9GAMM|nr:exodeoxyribonuclease VII small subunit [Natronospira sp. AB-CW4]MDQ2068536.1 exodeoxyribonuclease VII small subunit [Natronospira sp. AB-CW4]